MTLVLLFNQVPTGQAHSRQAKQIVSASGFVSAGGGGGGGNGTATAPVLRTYGRLGGIDGIGGTWVEVTSDANGFNENVYLTTLCQVLKLGLGESPFWANYGIPAQQSVIMQVFPDYYAAQTQTQFAKYFASLVITRVPQSNPPTYNVRAVTFAGSTLTAKIAT